MRKILLCLSICLGFCMFLVSCKNNSEEIRIRILADDNSKESIEFKYIVKDQTLQFLKNTTYQNPRSLVVYLNNCFNELYDNNNIVVSFEDVMYPAKVLDGKMVPSGSYPTLLITIGTGSGSNWWSILYPEFFGVSYESSSEVEYRSYFYELFKK